jgi:iron(III) transport system ATP-binding protein
VGANNFLDLRHIRKEFGGFTALHDINLGIRKGEFVCFLGPSGCGKTTLLRIIAGLETADTADLRIAGRNLADIPARERNFGIVFQSYSLFPNMSVARNIAYGLECRKWPRADIAARVEAMLALVNLADHAAKQPHQLSGGQQQRVALARALAPNPAVLLLDEPLSALDAKVREDLRAEIKELQSRLSITTIMVTHDQHEAMEVADRIVVMNRGRIEQDGRPVDLYERPATRFVAEFIGRMNLFAGTVTDARSVRTASGVEISLPVPREMPVGANVSIAVRPERARLTSERTARGLALAGTVRQVFYLGATREYRVDLEGGERGLVETPNDGSDARFASGDTVWLTASFDDCRLIAGGIPRGRP